MIARKRRRFDARFKAKVALEAVRGLRTVISIGGQQMTRTNCGENRRAVRSNLCRLTLYG